MSTILLLEDDESMRQLLAMVVGTAGHEVVEAADGEAAIALLTGDCRVDLVVCDLLMWGMDGLRFLRWLRASPYARTPVLVVTGMDTADIRERALKAGADDVMIKPVRATELKTRIAALLQASAAG